MPTSNIYNYLQISNNVFIYLQMPVIVYKCAKNVCKCLKIAKMSAYVYKYLLLIVYKWLPKLMVQNGENISATIVYEAICTTTDFYYQCCCTIRCLFSQHHISNNIPTDLYCWKYLEEIFTQMPAANNSTCLCLIFLRKKISLLMFYSKIIKIHIF